MLQVNPQRGRLVARSIIPTGAPKETLFTMSAVPLGNDSSLVGATTVHWAILESWQHAAVHRGNPTDGKKASHIYAM